MDYALQLQNVTKSFKHSDFLLDHISFALPKGAIMGFVGENGAGKTTTIGCIMNTLRIDSGSIQVLGQTLNGQNPLLSEQIGIVYDGDNFPSYLTANQLEHILQGIYSAWDPSLFQKFLERFELNRTLKISKYSKGMSMKLAIAVALSHHPKLLILDEATAGLDPVIRDEMLDLFLDFIEDPEHSILLSSHITSDLEKIADYITFIHKGKIILTETKDHLIYQYGILRCRQKEFEQINTTDILAYRKRNYQIDVLVANRHTAEKNYKNLVIDPATIDEIMLLLTKEERI